MAASIKMFIGEYREQPFNILQDNDPWTGMAAVFTGDAKLVMTWKVDRSDDNTEAVLTKECPAPAGTAGVWTVDDIGQAETTIYLKLADTKDLEVRAYAMDVWLVRNDGEWIPLTGVQTADLKRGVTWPEAPPP